MKVFWQKSAFLNAFFAVFVIDAKPLRNHDLTFHAPHVCAHFNIKVILYLYGVQIFCPVCSFMPVYH